MSPVEGGILALVGLAVGTVALVFLRARANALHRARGRVLHGFAVARGLVLRERPRGFQAGGAMRGIEVHLTVDLGRGRRGVVRFTARPTVPVPRVVVLERRDARPPQGLGELSLGDIPFEAALVAFGSDDPVTKGALSARARADLLALGSPATSVTRLELGPQEIILELTADTDELFTERWLAAALDFVIAFATGRRGP